MMIALFPAFFLLVYFSLNQVIGLALEDKNCSVSYLNPCDDSDSCQSCSSPYQSISVALQNIPKNSTSVCISIKGICTLNNTEFNHIDGKDTVIIKGDHETAQIHCEQSAGLFISNSTNVTIKLVTFNSCSMHHGIFQNCFYQRISFQPAAVVFLNCKTILLNDVTLKNSSGSGLFVFLNETIPQNNNNNVTVTIAASSITDGRGTSTSQVGGGVIIAAVQDIAKDTKLNVSATFNGTNLTNNSYTKALKMKHDNKLFAGALVIIGLTNISVVIDSCEISNNNKGLTAVYMYHLKNQFARLYLNDTRIVNNTNGNVIAVSAEDSNVQQLELILFNAIIANHLTVHQQKYITRSERDGSKSCDVSTKLINPIIYCSKEKCSDKQKNNPFINFLFSCIHSNSNIPGMCSIDFIDYKAHCPVSYSNENISFFTDTCYDNHNGTLCGQCKEGHSVAINSPYLSCAPCNHAMTVLKGWGLLIALEFIPVTFMVAVIALLNVNLNQGSLKAYIFFCQILTIPFPSVSYPSWFVIGYNYNFRIIDLALLPFSIWNLGFINYPSCNLFDSFNRCYSMSICISTNTSPLGAIVFWYVIGFYPFFLLLISYVFISMYYNGYRCVTCVIRPIHHLLARFWRSFNIQPSLTHTIASVYTLCFTQLAATSLKILHPTTYNNKLVFFYDGSVSYFHGWHGAAGSLALIVLIVFIIVPTVYLFVHPFKCFQLCFNKLNFRKDLLVSVTDVFTGPYKNGTNNSWDYRCFAAFNFILQVLIMVLYYFPAKQKVILLMQLSFCAISIIAVIAFRPYKNKIHSLTSIVLYLVLFSFSSIVLSPNSSFISLHVLEAVYSVLCLFFVFVPVVYFYEWLQRKMKISKQNTKAITEVTRPSSTNHDDDDYLLPSSVINRSYQSTSQKTS